MAEKKKTASIEELLDAVDKFKEGDETAFDGMTVQLDDDDSSGEN